MGKIYGRRKSDVEFAFGHLKAYLGFTRLSVRGTDKVKNELGFALLAVNFLKLTTSNGYRKKRIVNKSEKQGPKIGKVIFDPCFC